MYGSVFDCRTLNQWSENVHSVLKESFRRDYEMAWQDMGPGAMVEAYAQTRQWYKLVLFLVKGPYEFPDNFIKMYILIYHFPSGPNSLHS